MKVPQCPNCKHTSFKVHYVKRYKKSKDQTFKEYAKEVYEQETFTYQDTPSFQAEGAEYPIPDTITFSSNSTFELSLSSTISIVSPSLLDYLQIILECTHCGYTIVINIDEWKLLHAI